MSKEAIQIVEFDSQSAERYKNAANFMVKVAEDCFGITISPTVASCWVKTLELMYYTDHVLDQMQSPSEREQFGLYAIECMFADPLDWEYLNFGESNLDQALHLFRYSLLNIKNIDDNTTDTTLELFEQTELLKKQITIEGIIDIRNEESKKCSQMLMELGNNFSDEDGSEQFKEWFEKFWKFGNLADLLVDFGDDIGNGILQIDNSLTNRLHVGKIAVHELVELVKLSNPWLIIKYIKAGKFLLEDRQPTDSNFTSFTVPLETLNLRSEYD